MQRGKVLSLIALLVHKYFTSTKVLRSFTRWERELLRQLRHRHKETKREIERVCVCVRAQARDDFIFIDRKCKTPRLPATPASQKKKVK